MQNVETNRFLAALREAARLYSQRIRMPMVAQAPLERAPAIMPKLEPIEEDVQFSDSEDEDSTPWLGEDVSSQVYKPLGCNIMGEDPIEDSQVLEELNGVFIF